MRKNFVVLLVLVAALSAIFACKSVETTSAMLHNEHGQHDMAIEQAKAALANNPNDAEAHFQLGVAYSHTKMMREAYDEFTRAAQLDPKGKLENAENNIRSNWARHFNNGVAEYQSENFAGAGMEFEQTIAADPRQIKGWLNLAKAYSRISADDSTYLEKAFSIADTLLAKVTKEDDEYGDALALAGRLLIMRGDTEVAFGIFEKLIIDDPANFDILEEVGSNLMIEKEFANAALFLELAADGRMKTDSENFDLYYNLGVCYNKAKDYMKSVEAYQNTLMMKDDDKDANYALLLTYYEGELFDEAIMQGQKYTEMFPADPRGWQVLSLSYNKKGMKIMAEEAFKKYQEVTGQ
ncbi:MAG: tetratricopeptide repeat protein [Candidatus Krumholzibacteria bacterium]|nr:tetratricopeptide repeat protein [Candidatus Krumholzibacteria bacterium]